jgi:prevent-host-death family protein
MTTVNMHDAKTRLSKLVAAIRSGKEREVVIAVNGTPAARLVPIEARQPVKIGVLRGKFTAPADFDELNPEIEKLFYGKKE